MATGRELLGTVMDRNGQCSDCIRGNATYWCATSLEATSGICWSISESKEECLGSSVNPDDYLCSNDDGIPGRAKYLLCPIDSIGCGDTEDLVVNSTGILNRIYASYVTWYRTWKYKTYIDDSYTFPVLVDELTNETTVVTNSSYLLDIEYVSYALINVYK